MRNYVQMFRVILDLIRLRSSSGTMLLFLPCAFGTVINATRSNDLLYLILFLVGSFVMRSAGCVINDVFDAKFDREVERTKNRPIAVGKISIKNALIVFLILSACGLWVLLQLSNLAIVLGLLSIPLLMVYPLMKRYTYMPQLFLGLTFNIGVLIAAAAIKNEIHLHDVVLYIGCVFWTLGYDTVYAFMDYKDDLKVGVKSMAIKLKDRNYKNYLYIFYGIFYLSIIVALILRDEEMPYFLFLMLIMISFAIDTYRIYILDINNITSCLNLFKFSQVSGMIMLWAIIFTSKSQLLT